MDLRGKKSISEVGFAHAIFSSAGHFACVPACVLAIAASQ